MYEEMCPYFWFNVLNVHIMYNCENFKYFLKKKITFDYRSKFFLPFHFVP
jgi:hypothetical protein